MDEEILNLMRSMLKKVNSEENSEEGSEPLTVNSENDNDRDIIKQDVSDK